MRTATNASIPPLAARRAPFVLALAAIGALGCQVDVEDQTVENELIDRDSVSAGDRKLDPELDCVWDHGDGTFEAVFGYHNRSPGARRVELGPHNRFFVLDGDLEEIVDHGQPSIFLAGDHPDVFSVRAATGGIVAWQLGRRVELAHVEKGRCDAPPETGRSLFTSATFGGNGRTCATCHTPGTGTLSPADVATRPADDPLFRWDGLDNFVAGTTRIEEHATILVRMPLPPGIRLSDDPAADSIVVARGVPSTLNTPGLDPVLMLDGRAADLLEQARSAITGHAQATVEPTDDQLQRIADFQQTEAFFSSPRMADFFFFGQAPELPEGTTESERRGRDFFVDQPLGPDLEGVCALCHSGPMLNETNEFLLDVAADAGSPQPAGPGLRFFDVGVSVVNFIGNPVHQLVVTLPDGSEEVIATPDPGRVLITGQAANVNQFKITSLWGAVDTAPYFHDNSRKDLDQMLDHYDGYFGLFLGRTLTSQQREDVKAYMRLLR